MEPLRRLTVPRREPKEYGFVFSIFPSLLFNLYPHLLWVLETLTRTACTRQGGHIGPLGKLLYAIRSMEVAALT